MMQLVSRRGLVSDYAALTTRQPGRARARPSGRGFVLAIVVCLVLQPGLGDAATFDCGLAADRIADQLRDIRRDVAEYEAIEAELVAKGAALINDREAARLVTQRQIAAHIRKAMPSRIASLTKEIRQSQARSCLMDAQAREITAQATDAAAKVLDSPN